MPDFSIPATGMHTAVDALNHTAGRIARLPVSVQTGNPADEVNLSEEAVNLLMEKNVFQANTKTFHVMDELTKDTINLMK